MISKGYRDQLAEVHRADQKWGTSSHRWSDEVGQCASQMRARDLLDYGCGKGGLRPSLAEFPFGVREYDPGIPGKDSPPEPADLVVCLDVLEHVEPEHIDDVVRDLDRLARRGVFAVIALYRGGRQLPDGRPAHLIVESQEWWQEKLSRLWAGKITYSVRQVPGRPLGKRVRECLVVKLEKP